MFNYDSQTTYVPKIPNFAKDRRTETSSAGRVGKDFT